MRSQVFRKSFAFKALSFIQAAIFIFFSFALPAKTYAQSVMELPAPGSMVNPSANYVPVILRAVKIHPDQPLVFDFIVDSGNTHADQALIKSETQKLVKYFLASLTIPEKDLWVNLSPYEHDRIVPEMFGQTEMGRDLLAQDYILKQLTASFLDPEKGLGKEFWARVYAQVHEKLGTSEIPADTFNKVWIMPDSAQIYEMNDTAVLGKTRLKVMTEEDYLARENSIGSQTSPVGQDAAAGISTRVLREIILPAIEEEINTGKNFAPLRQVYQTLVLAVWYKNNLKGSLLGQVYADQNKIAGVDLADKDQKEKIYQRYIAAYKQGVFNLIKEEIDPVTHEVFPHKYFSGGNDLSTTGEKTEVMKIQPGQLPADVKAATGDLSQATVVMTRDAAQFLTGDNVEDFDAKHHFKPFDKGYLQGLFSKYNSGKKDPGKTKQLIIGENFMPSALMPPTAKLEDTLGAMDYKTQIRQDEYLAAAQDAVLWADEMNGGLGSSLVRKSYLKKNFGRDEISAKGPDMYFFLELQGTNEHGQPEMVTEPVSTTELKYLQVLKTASQYGQVKMQELVNDQSLEPMKKFLNETVYLMDRIDRSKTVKRTYRQVLENEKNITLPQEIVQASLPVIDVDTGLLTDEHTAPGGHGQLGSMALQEILTEPLPQDHVLIRALYNGDGTNNSPDPYIVGWMAKNKIPIVMISTTKTVLDKKGGLIGGEVLAGDKYVANMVELAQAKKNKQQDLFSEVGLTKGKKDGQFFNTNIALINYSVLKPLLLELQDIMKERFAEIVTPDLILNEKNKGNKKIIQLEGAMGSALLNLNRFVVARDDKGITEEQRASIKNLMKKYDRLLYIVNVDKESRDEFFTPVKYAWDHWLYAYSGHFHVDTNTWKLVNNSPGHLPGFGAMGGYYEDLQNMIDAFGRANVDKLDQIDIKIPVTRQQFEAAGLDYDHLFPLLVDAKNMTLEGLLVRETQNIDGKFKLASGITDDQFKILQALLDRSVMKSVQFKDAVLRGHILIEDNSDDNIVDLNTSEAKSNIKTGRFEHLKNGKLEMENVHVVIDEKGIVTVSDHAASNDRVEQLADVDRGQQQETEQKADDTWNQGGIDLNPASLNFKVSRTGKGVQVQVDPAEIQRIKAEGVTGFTPVIINIMPVKNMLPALGLVPAERELAGVAT